MQNLNEKHREEPMAERQKLLGLMTEIVSAHASNNAVAPDQLPTLIQQVFNTLATVEHAATAQPKPQSAVPVQRSVLKNHIVCLDCGNHFSMLKRHLMTDHKLTVEQYRQKWGLPTSYPMVAPDYAKVRSALAKNIGLGRKSAGPRKAARMAAKKGARG
jgi:predicted transcriptional regulator